jgi:5-methylcytosine-specific restriction enzyme A
MFDRREYKRRDIHNSFGGGRQGGISPSAKKPVILIFSGRTGKQHGYDDYWDAECFYHYTGEGQVGDMKFSKGNKALLEHEKNNKRIFLFENTRKGFCKYVNELELVDYRFFIAPDRNGNDRKAIKFKFISISDDSTEHQKVIKNGCNYNKPTTTERRGLVTSRVGQGYYRNQLLERWEGRCAVTGVGLTQILIASHITPWRDSTDEERLDVDNGILLSPNLDALFDKHLISFDDNGSIIFSTNLAEEIIMSMGINKTMRIKSLSKGNKKYLQKHRNKLV